ncbi:cytochrome b [Parasphingorhabdus sp.]|uniref:cytochrome b n=1 Tax=Parasphingorhabdus sp. TaxID=2709688 RepID=UPI003298451D
MTLFGVIFAGPALAGEMRNPVPDGLLPHFESLIALGIVVGAVAIAWLLNHRAPKSRAFGTFLAAVACFAIVILFALVPQTGVLENPKPHRVPMDVAKPTLLWIQVGVALLAGLTLLGVAFKQSKSQEELVLSSANEEARYGRTSRILHWTTAILFISLIPTGIFGSMIPDDAWYKTKFFVIHETIGFIIFGLFIFRQIWNRKSKRPKLESSLKPIERKMAHNAHITLYLLMFALPITGYLMTSMHGSSSYFFFVKLETFLPESEAYQIPGLFHKFLLQYLLYIILGAHVLGALKHHFVDKHKEAFKRMVS